MVVLLESGIPRDGAIMNRAGEVVMDGDISGSIYHLNDSFLPGGIKFKNGKDGLSTTFQYQMDLAPSKISKPAQTVPKDVLPNGVYPLRRGIRHKIGFPFHSDDGKTLYEVDCINGVWVQRVIDHNDPSL